MAVRLFLLLILFVVGCTTEKIIEPKRTNILGDTCWEYYQTIPIIIDGELYYGDLHSQWVMEDSTYIYTRALMNSIPGSDSPELTEDDDGNVIVVETNGYFWLEELYSDRSFSYVFQQTHTHTWDFLRLRWVETDGATPNVLFFIIGHDGSMLVNETTYTPCE